MQHHRFAGDEARRKDLGLGIPIVVLLHAAADALLNAKLSLLSDGARVRRREALPAYGDSHDYPLYFMALGGRPYSDGRRESDPGASMSANTRIVEINAEVFEMARRTAALDKVDVPTLVEDLVRRHADCVGSLQEVGLDMPRFSLDQYELQRDSDETDADYEARQNLFR